MTRTLILVAALLTSACGGVVPVHVVWADSTETERAELLERTEAALGVPIVETGSEYGAIRIDVVPETDDVRSNGKSIDVYGCRRRVRSIPRATTLAHEIGHALHLTHVNDGANLMHVVASDGIDLTDAQLDTLHRELGKLDACPLAD